MTGRSDPTCMALFRALYRASRMVEDRVRRTTEARGLGPSDFGILEQLHESGTLPINALGERVGLTSGSMTTAVDRLSRRKLVTRRASPQDARLALVALLPAGRALIRCAMAEHSRAVSKALSALGEGERRDALALLTKLIGASA